MLPALTIRQMSAGCPASHSVVAATVPMGTDVVVVELGYNDDPAQMSTRIDAMMTALQKRGVRRVAWVNMAEIRTSGGSSLYAPSNAALVKRAVEICEKYERPVANYTQARQILGLRAAA